MRRLNRLLAVVATLLLILAAVALTAPLHGCTRTAQAIGNVVESIGCDFNNGIRRLTTPRSEVKSEAVATR